MTSSNDEEPLNHLVSIGDWIRWAASRFDEAQLHFGHGTENAWDEAVNLVLTSLHLPPQTNPGVVYAAVTPSERHAILQLIQRRIETRKPLAYLLKKAWFCNHSFYVDERVLIPRSPMAEWIEKQFAPWIDDPDRVQRVLDIGTGSGCIAIAAALAFPQAEVDAADISADALAVARINVDRYGLKDRVHLHESDCFEGLPHQRYDIILSNPPYVGAEEFAGLPQEYRHEPALALQAGHEGLDVVQRILANAKRFLTKEGILVVEVGNTEAAFAKHYPHTPCTWLDLEQGGGGLFLLTAKQL